MILLATEQEEDVWAKFAAAALAHPYTQNEGGDRDADKAASWAATVADALLKEFRERQAA